MGPPMLGFPIFGFLIFMLPIFMLPVFLLPMLVNFVLPIFGFLMLDFPIWVSNLYASNLCASNSWVSKFCTSNAWASNLCASNIFSSNDWVYNIYQPLCLQYLGFQSLLFQTALPPICELAISAHSPISAPIMATMSPFLQSMDDSRKENYYLRSSWGATLAATDALFVLPPPLVSMPTALVVVLVSFAVE